MTEIADFSEIGAKMADFEIAGSIGADSFADLSLFKQGFDRVVTLVCFSGGILKKKNRRPMGPVRWAPCTIEVIEYGAYRTGPIGRIFFFVKI